MITGRWPKASNPTHSYLTINHLLEQADVRFRQRGIYTVSSSIFDLFTAKPPEVKATSEPLKTGAAMLRFDDLRVQGKKVLDQGLFNPR